MRKSQHYNNGREKGRTPDAILYNWYPHKDKGEINGEIPREKTVPPEKAQNKTILIQVEHGGTLWW